MVHIVFCFHAHSIITGVSFSTPFVERISELAHTVFFYFSCCTGSLLLPAGFLWLPQEGAALHCGAWVSHGSGLIAEHRLQAQASAVVAHGLSCSVAGGIFSVQGSNPCPLHRQVYSYPVHHQENPGHLVFNYTILCCNSISPTLAKSITKRYWWYHCILNIFLHKRYEFCSKQPYGGVALTTTNRTTSQPSGDFKARASLSFEKSAGLLPLFAFSLCMFRFC